MLAGRGRRDRLAPPPRRPAWRGRTRAAVPRRPSPAGRPRSGRAAPAATRGRRGRPRRSRSSSAVEVARYFGGVRALEDVSLTIARGRDGRPGRAERVGQDDAGEPAVRRAAADPGHIAIAGQRHRRAGAAPGRARRRGPDLPDPAAVRVDDRAGQRGHGRHVRPRPAAAGAGAGEAERHLGLVGSDQLADALPGRAQPAPAPAAGDGPGDRGRAAGAAARRGAGRAQPGRDRRRGRGDPADPRGRRHDRDRRAPAAGAQPAGHPDRRARPGRADRRRRAAGGAERPGGRARLPGEACAMLEVRGLDAAYGDAQALWSVDLDVGRGRDGRRRRSQRRRQVHPGQHHRRAAPARAPARSPSTASTSSRAAGAPGLRPRRGDRARGAAGVRAHDRARTTCAWARTGAAARPALPGGR